MGSNGTSQDPLIALYFSPFTSCDFGALPACQFPQGLFLAVLHKKTPFGIIFVAHSFPSDGGVRACVATSLRTRPILPGEGGAQGGQFSGVPPVRSKLIAATHSAGTAGRRHLCFFVPWRGGELVLQELEGVYSTIQGIAAIIRRCRLLKVWLYAYRAGDNQVAAAGAAHSGRFCISLFGGRGRSRLLALNRVSPNGTGDR